jgi:tripartite-type tricarboxylate transporter receptor subunit TctC
MELLMRDTGMKLEMVPFRGDAPLIQAFMSGDIHVAVIPSSAAKPQMDSGVVRALGVTSAKRIGAMPDVPTLAEQGLPDFTVSGWMALFAPAGTPGPIIERLAKEAGAAMQAPDMAPRLATFGMEAAAFGPQAMDALYKADRAKFQKIVKEANIALQD